MVFYFTSSVVSPPVTLFMGADKHESNMVYDIFICMREINNIF